MPNVSGLQSWPKPLELRRQGLERYLSSSPRGRGRFVYRFHPVSWIWNERSVRVAQKKRLEKRRRMREEKESEFTKTVESWLGGGDDGSGGAVGEVGKKEGLGDWIC